MPVRGGYRPPFQTPLKLSNPNSYEEKGKPQFCNPNNYHLPREQHPTPHIINYFFFTTQLVDLWNKYHQLFILLLESADEVYQLLSQEVFCLQELYAKCRWMLESHALIEAFKSFRLLEEENLGPIYEFFSYDVRSDLLKVDPILCQIQ
ncbi:hypothetical protein Glove_355g67 [Diversispora epigaea]|uniref:Uncharacterized protein n=1 Tax=Diversispora epigaea TaxID=1348612 RepID=A0A397HB85_9GLOM|nr:hypothetical protein Glove_355g67 [Diversispora epigaea]